MIFFLGENQKELPPYRLTNNRRTYKMGVIAFTKELGGGEEKLFKAGYRPRED